MQGENIILPDYQRIAESLYRLIKKYDVDGHIAIAEVLHELQHAQNVGYSLGYDQGYREAILKMTMEQL